MNLRVVLNGVRRNWNRPYFYRMRFLEKIVAPVHQRMIDDPGINMYDEDWDNLIILDACRADLFEETIYDYELGGNYSTKRTNGSGSVEFLQKTFRGRDCSDTVYVTAKPHVLTELDSPFHAVDHVWDTN